MKVGGTFSQSEIELRFLNFPACGIIEIHTDFVENITTYHLEHQSSTVLKPEYKVTHNSFLLPLLSAAPSKTEIRTGSSSLFTQTDKQ